MTQMRIFLLLSILLPLASYGSYVFDSENTLQGVRRDYPGGSSALSDINEGYFESRSSARYNGDSFQFEASALVRSLYSPSNKDRSDFSFVDLTPPRRLLKFYTPLGNNEGMGQSYLDLGSAWGSYQKGSWQFTLGRRAIGIGVLRAFPVWNRLYPVVPTVSGYMFHNNPDIADVRWSKDQWTVATYSIFSQYYDDAITGVEFIHYGSKLESHVLLSRWWLQQAAGYSGVVDTDFGMFRLESLGIAAGNNLPGGLQYGVGWEKAFSEKMSFLVEYYYSSFGTKNANDYLLQRPTPFRTLLGKKYIYPRFSYKLTDFMTTDLGALTNLVDGSYMITSETNYSLSDNLDLFLLIRKPMGSSGDEFGHLKVPEMSQVLEYVEWVSMGLKLVI